MNTKTDLTKQQYEKMRSEVIKLLEKFSKDNCYNLVDREYLEVDYYFQYDEVEYIQNDVKKLIKNGSTLEVVRNTIFDLLYENELYGENLQSHIQKEFIEEYHKELEKITCNWSMIDEVYLFLDLDLSVYYRYDIDDIINDTKLDTLIFLENEDAFDLEFSNNNFMDMLRYAKSKEDYHEWLEDSSVKMLLISQGYTMDQLVDYLYYDIEEFDKELNQLRSDNVFCSIVEEIENAQNYQSLVMLTQMTVNEYFLVNELDSYLISKNSEVGYVGVINGSGSILNVQLNNDIQLEKDQFKIKVDGAIGYSVAEVYGMDFSAL